jgi:predicted phosphodiesterase
MEHLRAYLVQTDTNIGLTNAHVRDVLRVMEVDPSVLNDADLPPKPAAVPHIELQSAPQDTAMAPLTRCAVIGDVHAEHGRLELALQAAASLAVDAILCTGDVVDGSGSVPRCCALLRQYNVTCVRGNHDRWLFTGLLRDLPATQLSELADADREFLRQLPPTRDIPTVAGLMLLCHGIGRHDLEKITSFDTDYSLSQNRFLQEVADARRYRLMVSGHTHERLTTRVGELVVVNAGAIHRVPDAGFLLLDFAANRLQWHAIYDDRGVELAHETAIFLR